MEEMLDDLFHSGPSPSLRGALKASQSTYRRSERKNDFTVVASNKPSIPNAMAVDSDGSDFTYFSVLKFGSSRQEMYMLIDSGSANTWVMGSDCDSSACKIHNTFGSQDSTSLHKTSQTWSLAYGTGEVTGVVANDTVSFANYTLHMGFGLASTASDDFNSYPMDGILGLGRPSSDALGTPTLMEVLDQQGNLSNNIIGVHLQRASDGTKDGQITFGGVDHSKFSGKLGYTKVTNDASWEIPADDAGVDSKAVGFTGKSAILDTGTSYILMPPSDAQKLHSLIPGTTQNGEIFVVPCSSNANLYFTFSGVRYTVSPKDYVGQNLGNGCQSKVIGHQAFGPDEWILGAVFLKNVYTVFDFDNNQIGLGIQSTIESNSTGNTISTTSTTSSSSTNTASSSHTFSAKSSKTTAESSSTSGSSSSPAASATSSGPGDSSPFGSSDLAASSASRTGLSILSNALLALIIGWIL
ncbi:hypothetical protein PV08_02903 [Exophiala spinifera]|uniref:Peptidase A1 domain-containing protein n=1 Tax=Exophiala spinifera TaxID=91928 RepID=A0A0D2C4V2_9EURO|nr:uncharacterized protein PV08_02903 [Exophiala spinifera]KIW18614.1 hypothetical protein PV08_02903 [Exophiala spinifera]